jgi:hypothetical protein
MLGILLIAGVLLGVLLQVVEPELPEFWIFVVTIIIVPALVQVFKLIAQWRGKELRRLTSAIVAAIISLVIAGIIIRPELPVLEDPMTFLSEMMRLGGAIMGYATLVYNLILARLFEAIHFAPDWQIARSQGKVGTSSDATSDPNVNK